MKAAVAALALGGLSLVSGCAHDYLYVPVGPGAAGGPAVRYPIPPAAPQGEVYVTSFGFTDIDVGPGAPGTLLHARLAVSNGSAAPWTVDGRRQALTFAGRSPVGAAFLNTDAGVGPVYVVPPAQARVFDLYYALPPPFDQAINLGAFQLDWQVEAGGPPVTGRTSFQRFEGAPPGAYPTYPPYVTVGLGFGVGWWYGPYYPYRRGYPPIIRHYYYPPARGTWRGVPPGGPGLRGAPPPGAGGLRGSPPPAGGGGIRGTPPSSSSVRAAPAPGRSMMRGGGGGRGRGR